MAYKFSLNNLIDELNALNDKGIGGALAVETAYGEEGAPVSLRYQQAVKITVEFIPYEQD